MFQKNDGCKIQQKAFNHQQFAYNGRKEGTYFCTIINCKQINS